MAWATLRRPSADAPPDASTLPQSKGVEYPIAAGGAYLVSRVLAGAPGGPQAARWRAPTPDGSAPAPGPADGRPAPFPGHPGDGLDPAGRRARPTTALHSTPIPHPPARTSPRAPLLPEEAQRLSIRPSRRRRSRCGAAAEEDGPGLCRRGGERTPSSPVRAGGRSPSGAAPWRAGGSEAPAGGVERAAGGARRAERRKRDGFLLLLGPGDTQSTQVRGSRARIQFPRPLVSGDQALATEYQPLAESSQGRGGRRAAPDDPSAPPDAPPERPEGISGGTKRPSIGRPGNGLPVGMAGFSQVRANEVRKRSLPARVLATEGSWTWDTARASFAAT